MKSSYRMFVVLSMILILEASAFVPFPRQEQPQSLSTHYPLNERNTQKSELSDHAQPGLLQQNPQKRGSRSFQSFPSSIDRNLYGTGLESDTFHHRPLGISAISPLPTVKTRSTATADSFSSLQDQPGNIVNGNIKKIFNIPLPAGPLRDQIIKLPISGEASSLKLIHLSPPSAFSADGAAGISSDVLKSLKWLKSDLSKIQSHAEAYSETDYIGSNRPTLNQINSRRGAQPTWNDTGNQDTSYNSGESFIAYNARGVPPATSYSDSKITTSIARSFENQDIPLNDGNFFTKKHYPQKNYGVASNQQNTISSVAQATSAISNFVNNGSEHNNNNSKLNNVNPQSFRNPNSAQVTSDSDSKDFPSDISSFDNVGGVNNGGESYLIKDIPLSNTNYGVTPNQLATSYGAAHATVSTVSDIINHGGVYNGNKPYLANDYPYKYRNSNSKSGNPNNWQDFENQTVVSNSGIPYNLYKNTQKNSENQDFVRNNGKPNPPKNNNWKYTPNQDLVPSSDSLYLGNHNTWKNFGNQHLIPNSGKPYPDNDKGKDSENQDVVRGKLLPIQDNKWKDAGNQDLFHNSDTHFPINHKDGNVFGNQYVVPNSDPKPAIDILKNVGYQSVAPNSGEPYPDNAYSGIAPNSPKPFPKNGNLNDSKNQRINFNSETASGNNWQGSAISTTITDSKSGPTELHRKIPLYPYGYHIGSHHTFSSPIVKAAQEGPPNLHHTNKPKYPHHSHGSHNSRYSDNRQYPYFKKHADKFSTNGTVTPNPRYPENTQPQSTDLPSDSSPDQPKLSKYPLGPEERGMNFERLNSPIDTESNGSNNNPSDTGYRSASGDDSTQSTTPSIDNFSDDVDDVSNSILLHAPDSNASLVPTGNITESPIFSADSNEDWLYNGSENEMETASKSDDLPIDGNRYDNDGESPRTQVYLNKFTNRYPDKVYPNRYPDNSQSTSTQQTSLTDDTAPSPTINKPSSPLQPKFDSDGTGTQLNPTNVTPQDTSINSSIDNEPETPNTVYDQTHINSNSKNNYLRHHSPKHYFNRKRKYPVISELKGTSVSDDASTNVPLKTKKTKYNGDKSIPFLDDSVTASEDSESTDSSREEPSSLSESKKKPLRFSSLLSSWYNDDTKQKSIQTLGQPTVRKNAASNDENYYNGDDDDSSNSKDSDWQIQFGKFKSDISRKGSLKQNSGNDEGRNVAFMPDSSYSENTQSTGSTSDSLLDQSKASNNLLGPGQDGYDFESSSSPTDSFPTKISPKDSHPVKSKRTFRLPTRQGNHENSLRFYRRYPDNSQSTSTQQTSLTDDTARSPTINKPSSPLQPKFDSDGTGTQLNPTNVTPQDTSIDSSIDNEPETPNTPYDQTHINSNSKNNSLRHHPPKHYFDNRKRKYPVISELKGTSVSDDASTNVPLKTKKTQYNDDKSIPFLDDSVTASEDSESTDSSREEPSSLSESKKKPLRFSSLLSSWYNDDTKQKSIQTLGQPTVRKNAASNDENYYNGDDDDSSNSKDSDWRIQFGKVNSDISRKGSLKQNSGKDEGRNPTDRVSSSEWDKAQDSAVHAFKSLSKTAKSSSNSKHDASEDSYEAEYDSSPYSSTLAILVKIIATIEKLLTRYGEDKIMTK